MVFGSGAQKIIRLVIWEGKEATSSRLQLVLVFFDDAKVSGKKAKVGGNRGLVVAVGV